MNTSASGRARIEWVLAGVALLIAAVLAGLAYSSCMRAFQTFSMSAALRAGPDLKTIESGTRALEAETQRLRELLADYPAGPPAGDVGARIERQGRAQALAVELSPPGADPRGLAALLDEDPALIPALEALAGPMQARVLKFARNDGDSTARAWRIELRCPVEALGPLLDAFTRPGAPALAQGVELRRDGDSLHAALVFILPAGGEGVAP